MLPLNFTGIDFVLTALFLTIFLEQWLSAADHRPAIVGVAVTTGCLVLFGADLFLIPSMAIITAILALSPKTSKEAQHD